MSVFDDKLYEIFATFRSKNDWLKLLIKLDRICKKLGISTTIIGGMAVAAWGYLRYTSDVDLLIKTTDVYKLVLELQKIGFEDIGSNKVKKDGLIINLCADSVKVGGNKFPPPESDEPGIKVATLPLLIKLKILANRQKDRADVVELIKINKLALEYLNNEIVPLLNKMDQKLIIKLWEVAQKEMES